MALLGKVYPTLSKMLSMMLPVRAASVLETWKWDMMKDRFQIQLGWAYGRTMSMRVVVEINFLIYIYKDHVLTNMLIQSNFRC